jgi:GalNAc-alpha-(1->4)-GalNAc-alpha-(1->3)-diNAcBac-PP-undecaprenol alpha-1,4-N-acetyl-D-galactosaminyltransferase
MIYIIEENIDRMGGVERIVSLLSNHLSMYNDVTVISVFKNDLSFFEYDKNIKRVYLSNEKFSKSRIPNKLKYLLLVFKIKNICKKINSNDTVIFGRVPVSIKFLPFINKNANVIVRDAINLHDYSDLVKKLILRIFPLKVNSFVLSSYESLKEYKLFFGETRINYHIIYNPLGIKLIDRDYNFDNKIIFSNGRFDFQKGFEQLIRAFSIVHANNPDWKLVLIGDGPLKDIYKRIILENGLQNSAILKKATKNIEEELIKASIFVMTSRYEGYANSLVEAMALGIPCITYDWLTGANEIITNGKNGIVVDLADRFDYFNGIDNEDNVFKLANAIDCLISNKKLCLKFNKNSKKILDSRNNKNIFNEWEKLIYEKNIK